MDTSRQLFSRSSTSGFINNTSAIGKDDNIKVVVRVRPLNQMEITRGGRKCIKDQNPGENTIVLATQEAKQFTYDVVANQHVSQEDLFRKVAMPVANQCLQGYNGTIFAYGQTGAGKTYTIQGPTQHYRSQQIDENEIGIMPRVFDFIFGHIELSSMRGDVTFLVKCRYIQIYMEKIYDLLQPEMPQLQLREDLKRGVYVQNAIQEHVRSAREALELQRRGATNRHIGETAMNKESSRSHSIFTLSIEQKEVKQDGLCNIRSCQFHLIDLAGSERQKKTGAEGERLKQASNINLSLTNLGTVINILSEGKQDHTPYRNSKITFLLRDSLGGNSKTVIVANISPSVLNLNQTISTLNFAQRAKMIKNKAIINQDTTGTVSLLRQQIIRLKKRLSIFQNQGAPLSFIASPIPRRFASDFVDNDLLIDQQQQQNQMQQQSGVRSILQNGTVSGINQRQMQLQALLVQNNQLLINQEKAYENQIASKIRQIQQLKRTVQIQDANSKRNTMIIKLRESTIDRFKKGGVTCQTLQSQIAALRQEIKLLKDIEQYKNPHIAKLMSQNNSLKQQIKSLKNATGDDRETLYRQLHESNNFLEQLNEYIQQTYSLRTQLQQKLQGLSSTDGAVGGDIQMAGCDDDCDSNLKSSRTQQSDLIIHIQSSQQQQQELHHQQQQQQQQHIKKISSNSQSPQLQNSPSESQFSGSPVSSPSRRNKLQGHHQNNKHRKHSKRNDSLSSKQIQLLDAQSNKKFQQLEEMLQQKTEQYQTKLFQLNQTLQVKEQEFVDEKRRFQENLVRERDRFNSTLQQLQSNLEARDNKDISQLKFQIVRLEEQRNQATNTANDAVNQLEKVNFKFQSAQTDSKESRNMIVNLQKQVQEKERSQTESTRQLNSTKKQVSEQKSMVLYLKTQNKELSDKLYEQQKKMSVFAAERQKLNDQLQSFKQTRLSMQQELETIQTAHSYKQTQLQDATLRCESLTKDLQQANGVISDLTSQVDHIQKVVVRFQEEKQGDNSSLKQTLEENNKLCEEVNILKNGIDIQREKIQMMQLEYEQQSKKLEISLNQKEEMSQQLRDVMNGRDILKNSVSEKQLLVNQMEEKIIDICKQLDKREEQRKKMTDDIATLHQSRNQIERSGLLREEALREKNTSLQKEFKQITQQNLQIKKLLLEVREKSRLHESNIQHLKPTITSLNQENHQLRTQLQKIEAQKEFIQKSKDDAVNKLQAEFSEFRNRIHQYSNKVETKNDNIAHLNIENKQMKKNFDTVQAEKAHLQARCKDIERKLKQSQQRLYQARNIGKKFYDRSNQQVAKAVGCVNAYRELQNQISETLSKEKLRAERDRDDYKRRLEFAQKQLEKEHMRYQSQIQKMQDEVQSMEEQQLRLLGHGNKKQKINILQDLKIENNELKTRNRKAESDCFRWKTTIKDISAMLDDYVPELRDFLSDQRVSQDQRAILNVKQIIEKYKQVKKNLDSQRIRTKMAQLNTNSPSPPRRSGGTMKQNQQNLHLHSTHLVAYPLSSGGQKGFGNSSSHISTSSSSTNLCHNLIGSGNQSERSYYDNSQATSASGGYLHNRSNVHTQRK